MRPIVLRRLGRLVPAEIALSRRERSETNPPPLRSPCLKSRQSLRPAVRAGARACAPLVHHLLPAAAGGCVSGAVSQIEKRWRSSAVSGSISRLAAIRRVSSGEME